MRSSDQGLAVFEAFLTTKSPSHQAFVSLCLCGETICVFKPSCNTRLEGCVDNTNRQSGVIHRRVQRPAGSPEPRWPARYPHMNAEYLQHEQAQTLDLIAGRFARR